MFLPGGFLLKAEVYSPEEIYRLVLPGVVTLEVDTRNGEKHLGSAFLVNTAGVAATAWHLIQDARHVTARFSDQTKVAVAGLIDKDETKDIALIKLKTLSRACRPFSLHPPPVGGRAYAIGAPYGYAFSISEGLISQIQFIDGFLQYQISCSISPGNSGGPVVNGAGELLGVVCWSKKDAQNLSFATPASWLAKLKSNAPVMAWSSLPKMRASKRTGQPASLIYHQTTATNLFDNLLELP